MMILMLVSDDFLIFDYLIFIFFLNGNMFFLEFDSIQLIFTILHLLVFVKM